jgi:hypothetical protein
VLNELLSLGCYCLQAAIANFKAYFVDFNKVNLT